MELIELHILQSFPVSCLNRDDVGAPKTAMFGGVTRARISSQCLKRAIREFARDNLPTAHFNGQRTKLVVPLLEKRLLDEHRFNTATAREFAKLAAGFLGGLDDEQNVKTLLFLSPAELDSIAKAIADKKELKTLDSKIGPALEAAEKAKDDKQKEAAKKALEKLLKEATGYLTKDTVAKAIKHALKDAADISVFGRMVASDHSLTIEGAGLFSHALSTHRTDNEIDFYSAVDEAKSGEEDAGAGMMGTLEFNAAVYYRYAALNLGMLADKNHLAALKTDERRGVVNAFVRATLLAVPSARKNSMNGHNPPAYALGIYKKEGQPVQLINAFEQAVWSRNGLIEKSIEALKAHHAKLKETWNIQTREEVAIPDVDLNTFCQRLTVYVE